ncbi:LysR family transcriptional regulator [Pseudomonas lactis]|uniref:LysR family transcriptional regulator n=1 Tax=Pseudomonas lactis TaxID=1615674 RepID=A0A7Y1LB26_9PSED|nr:LysR family transcriptional regulator [Pseudomonas lactis]NNA42840.1 LysR family transcriptional regulator [Pseudomonas lactis]
MDLNAIQMFVAVAHMGSLSAAATHMEIPLQTLSRRIRELEHGLKVQLLHRSMRGTRLTEAGEILYEYASRGIEAFAEGKSALVSDQDALRGRLRVTLPIAYEPWGQLLCDFQQRYPEIELAVYFTEDCVDLIAEGIDVALRVGAIEQDTLVARHMISYRHQTVASPTLLERLGKPNTPDDLFNFPCATWSKDSSMRSKWTLGDQTIQPATIITTNNYLHLRNCALNGDCITELPPFLATQAIQEGRLLSVLDNHPMPEKSVHLLYPSHRYPSRLVRAYLDYCQEHLRNRYPSPIQPPAITYPQAKTAAREHVEC